MTVDSGRRSLGAGLRATFVLLAALTGALWFFGSSIDQLAFEPSTYVVISFLPSSALLLMNILREANRRPYSLHLMHLLACVLLLVAAPMLQYLTNSFPTAGIPRLRDPEVAFTNVQVFFWICAYSIGYARSSKGRHLRLKLPLLERTTLRGRSWLVVTIGVAALAYLAYRGTAFAFTRSAFGAAAGAKSTMEHMLIMLPRTIPMLALLWLILLRGQVRRRQRLTVDLGLFVLGVGILIVNNPLAGARIWTLTNLLAVAVVLFLWRFKTATALLPLVAVAPLLMSLLNVGRRSKEFTTELIVNQQTASAQDPMLTGDFDAFQNFVLMNRWVEATDIVWGRQLLGALLFWVPRALWPAKPVGTGAFLAEKMGLAWKNVAMPLPAEAYINFGWAGLVIAAVGFGVLLRYLDHRYFDRGDLDWRGGRRLLDVVYPMWLGFVVFTTRGDLINSVAFMAAVTVSATITLFLSSTRTTRVARSHPPREGSPTRPLIG